MSDRICIHSGQKIQTIISPENLIGCCEKCGNRCGGGYPNAAWVQWYLKGIVTGGDYNDHDHVSFSNSDVKFSMNNNFSF